ncbi:MAG: transporter substrate-binding domain-containing protein [Erysipelotrichaceae bacterium]|nr:transporter substrate-binding domain-containing protein [Erysipelotrichaceae bacterium]
MKKFWKLTMAAAMTVGLVACGSSASQEENKESANVLTVGISPDYKPYEYLDKNNEMKGFDIDMVELFEGYLKEDGEEITLEFKQMDFDNIITQIQGDQVDLGISGFTYSEDRKVEWSNPYLGTSQVAVLPADSEIATLDDLKGKSLVAQTGATGEQAAKEVEGAEVTGLKNVQDIMNALSAHQYDAAIVDLGVAKNYVANGEYKMLEGSLMDEKNYIIAKEGNKEVIDKMNKCIEKFLASEDYAKLCEKYDLSPLETE